ncbi:MAG: pyridoxine 5'-phosphate synthase [Gammaproteobacteria bacterium]|nr:pyridoxine 5'-phosphate synthase [Gammaproteobacteria bacterium]
MTTKSQLPLLGVNVDHVASVRQARGTPYPDPVEAALVAEAAGADGITVHLREDRRHIQERDVLALRDRLRTRLNLEMAPTEFMVAFALRVRPEFCCLVPERREELTTEGGLDVARNLTLVRDAVARLSAAGILCSLFIEPASRQIDAAVAAGTPLVELHTGRYADAPEGTERNAQLAAIRDAARHARRATLTVNAGHGLDYHNVTAIAALPELHELNIGHAIVARALFVGMGAAVGEMKRLLEQARAQ